MSEQARDAEASPAVALEEPVGAVLAQARAGAGLSLEEAAQRLKFAPRQLDVLERGEWGRLPGGAAVRGMVRSYARLLGLDADLMVARVNQGSALPDAERLAQRFRQPVPFSDAARRSNLAYVALSLALLAVVATVLVEWREERAESARLTFVSAAQQPAEPARVALASAAPATPATTAPATATANAAPANAEEAAETGERGRIVLRFAQESWVEVRSGTGKLLVAQLHPAGSERTVVGVRPFAMVIGNAHHVTLIYNDRPVDLTPHVKVEVARFTLE
jgi:cytoskeleton protein RodZ